MKKIRKIFSVVEREGIKLFSFINQPLYHKYYIKYLKKIGVKIEGNPNFISPSAYFDGSDYSKINIGENVTISMEVILLTHDGSIHTVHKGLNLKNIDNIKELEKFVMVKGITIGENSFIGAKALLMPGCNIGKNVIVGGGSVVRGTIPDNSIVMGNPAKIVGKTDQWIDKKIKRENFQKFSKKSLQIN